MKHRKYLRTVICLLIACLFLGLAPWYAGTARAAEIPTTASFDFEQPLDSNTKLPTGWSWVSNDKQCATEIVEDPTNSSNHVMKLGGEAGEDALCRAGYHYSTADNTIRAVLEYKVYLPQEGYNTTGVRLPTLSKDYLSVWIAGSGNICLADKDNSSGVAVANLNNQTSGWKTNSWHTVKIEGSADGTYKFYLNDIELKSGSVANTNDGNWMHWIHLGQWRKENANGYVYLDNIQITAIENVADTDAYCKFDFEGDSAASGPDGLPAGWTWHDTEFKFSPAVVTDPADGANHVFKITQAEETSLSKIAWAKYQFTAAPVDCAVLEYRVYIPADGTKAGYLPTFKWKDVNSAKLTLWIASATGNLCYADGNGSAAIAKGITGWHTIKIAADFKKSVYDLTLDGNLLLAGKKLIGDTSATNEIWMGAQSTGTICVDDITVSRFVPATAFTNFTLTAKHIRVGQTSKAVLTFEPQNASRQNATFSSSNESVARVDSLGNVTGVGAGTATITAAYVIGTETITKTAELTVTTSSIASMENFENTEDISKWETSTQTNAKISITEDSETNGNHALTIETYRDASTNWKAYTPKTVRYTYPLVIQETNETAALRKAVLKYRIKMDHCVSDNNIAGGMVFLPNFATASGDNPVMLGSTVSVICTSVNYKDRQVTKSIGGDEWHDIEWMVDLDRAVYDLYIDGELVANCGEVPVLSRAQRPNETLFSEWEPEYDENGKVKTHGQQKIIRTQDPITAIDMGFYLNTDAKMSIDNLQVLDYESATSWKISENQLTEVAVGNSLPLKLEFTTASGREASCRSAKIISSDEEIAVIDYDGSVIGKKAGTVTITITPNESGLESKTITVTVKDDIPATDIIGLADITLPVGGHQYINASIAPANAAAQELQFVSADETIAFVDEWGEILAKKAGSTKIIVSAGSFKKEITVTVNEPGVMREFNVTNAASLLNVLDTISSIDKSQMTGNIVVNLVAGYYQLTETMNLNETHGGSEKYSVIFRSNGAATIGGGIQIAGSAFTKGKDGIYVVDVPAGTKTRQLFVDNVRAVRARSEGKLVNASTLTENGSSVGMISENPEIANYANQDAIEFVYKGEYYHFRCGLDHAEATENGQVKLYMDMPGWFYVQSNFSHLKCTPDETLLYYENALELLDEPGEWYLDEAANKLYYMPRSFEEMSKVTVTIPALDGLISIEGTDYAHEVQNITFEGITFADATWMRPSSKNGHAVSQNNGIREWDTQYDRDFMPDGSVMVKKANSVNFRNCTFARLGTTALFMSDSVKNSTISENHFYDISGNGIAVGDFQYGYMRTNHVSNFNPSDPHRVMKNFTVTNNYIHNTGVDFFSSCAVSFGFAANVTISHNEIFDIPYSGISIGNGWNCRFTNVQKNTVITRNFIHDYMNEVYDGGGIYTIGNSGASAENPNVATYNYLSDMKDRYTPIYHDNGSTFWKDQYNVIDLSQREFFPDGSLPSWVLLNSDNHDITLQNNYTTTDRTRVSSKNVQNLLLEDNIVCKDADWPEAALDIIRNSGLNIANAESLRNNQAEIIECNTAGILELSVGEKYVVTLAIKDGKNNAIDADNVSVFYETENPEVAYVDPDGQISAKQVGTTQVHIYVVSNNILHEFACQVYVGAELAEIRLRNIEGTAINVEAIGSKKLTPYGVSNLGHEVTLTNIQYQVENKSIATVDAAGNVKPHVDSGVTTLTITATANGKTVQAQFTIKVLSAEGKHVVPYGTPVLDGKLDDVYARGEKIELGSVFYPNTSAVSDTEGYCYLAWDERYLYCYVYVSDAAVVSAGTEYISTTHPWANDDIEAYINTSLDNANGAMTKFACDAFGVRIYGHRASETPEIRSDLKWATAFTYNGEVIDGYKISNPMAGQNASTVEQPVNGYVIEMTLPLCYEMGVTDGTPQAGDQITFQLQVNDYDGGTPGDANSIVARKNEAGQYWLAAAPEVEVPVDKTQLKTAIDAASVIELDKYQSGTEKDTFVAALTAAKQIYADADATQEAVAGACDALTQAMRMLKLKDEPIQPTPILPIISAIAGGTGDNSISFRDVQKTDWFYQDVKFVVENNLMLGSDNTTFGSTEIVTRAMVATILWRMENEPTAKGTVKFKDVASGKWYSDAIVWTTENGIFTGYGNDLFGVNDPITREQLAAILYRYASYKAGNLSESVDISKYLDEASVSGYAQTAMQWSVGSGMLRGGTDNKLHPQNTATRAELAAILHRFAKR